VNSLEDKAAQPRIALPSLIDRAWEVMWAGRLACLVLCLDIALLVHPGAGLISLAQTGDIPFNVAWIAIFIAGYCFVVGFMMPAVFFVLRALAPMLSLTKFSERPTDSVAAIRVLKHALKDENDFLMDYYTRSQSRFELVEKNANTLAEMLASMAALGALNVFLGYYFFTSPSIVLAFANWSGMPGQLLVFAVLMVIAGTVSQIWLEQRRHYIYHPELARKEDEAKRK